MKKEKFSFSELRIIGISLAVLSLGIALAWIGFFWFLEEKGIKQSEEKTASKSGELR